MEWLNIQVNTARSPEFLGASHTERSVWFSLISYCAAFENGGVLPGAASWTTSAWMAAAGVSKKDVSACTSLVRTIGTDVQVLFYPVSQEKALNAKRAGGKKGATLRWDTQSPTHPPVTPHTQSPSECVKEGKGKEEEGKGSSPITQAFQILTEREELRSLSELQWVQIRQSHGAHPAVPAFGWVEWAKKMAGDAIIFRPDKPATWLSKHLGLALDEAKKTAGGGGESGGGPAACDA